MLPNVISRIKFICPSLFILVLMTSLFSDLARGQVPAENSAHIQKIETFFSTPGFHGDTSTAIEDQVIHLLKQAGASSKINIALYTFNRIPVAIEILKAQARGAEVRMVMDGKTKSQIQTLGSAVNILVQGYEGLPGLTCSDKSCITFCSGSCNGLWINHNKFFLFSQLNETEEFPLDKNASSETADGAQFVVAQTSSNMTDGQLKNYNDLVVVKDDPDFYKGMLGYWHRLNKNSFKFNKVKTIYGQNGIKSYFFPRLLGSDPVLKILKQVRCDVPDSIVRVVQSRFDDSRACLAEQLKILKSQGCDIKVIVRKEPSKHSPGKKVVRLLGDDVAILPYEDEDDENQKSNSVHSKILLINARMEGSTEKTTTVLTGSHNFNISSLRTNDETLFKINDGKTFDEYLNYWNRISEDAGLFSNGKN